MAEPTNDDDIDLLDLFLYAPIGLLYEYQEIIPKLVKRGKSQVQVGLLLGRMAAAKGTKEAEKQAGDVFSTLAAMAARGITEFGQVVGMAPPPDEVGDHVPALLPDGNGATSDVDEPARPLRLPIAGYDELTAKQVIALLDELSPNQRTRIREHEMANRGRKTILARLDALDS